MDKEIKQILESHIKNKRNKIEYYSGAPEEQTNLYKIITKNPGITINIYKAELPLHNYMPTAVVRSIQITMLNNKTKALFENYADYTTMPSTNPQDIIDFEHLYNLCQERVRPQKDYWLKILSPRVI